MDLYKKIHEGIRKDPVHTKKVNKKVAPSFTDARKTIVKTKKGEYLRDRRFTFAERKQALHMKMAIAKGEM
jgi:hypothetical protein